MKKRIALVTTLITFLFMGCGQDLPFEYRYTSANTVQIKYMNSFYELNRFGPRTNTPFQYAFEPDGDLDITIAGKTYDIDSPYDIDTKKKSSSKKKKRKKKKK